MSTTGSIKDMHYDFKQKLNRLDSNKYTGLNIPQIDRKLNKALDLYVLLVAQPRVKNQFGFEKIQRTIDDISILVANDVSLSTLGGTTDYVVATLPDDYLYYLSTSSLLASKDDCINQKMKTVVIKHDNRSNESEFYKSDFDWRECNIRFYDMGIKLFVNDFMITEFKINYIKKYPYMHNAEGFIGGTYNLPNGTTLTGFQDCILPDITHTEIIDLAVLLTTGDLELPLANQLIQNELSITQLINK